MNPDLQAAVLHMRSAIHHCYEGRPEIAEKDNWLAGEAIQRAKATRDGEGK